MTNRDLGQNEKQLQVLQERFDQNMSRHQGISWEQVKAKLVAHPKKLLTIFEMEKTGGEPDVVGQDKKTGEYIFYDCSPETPTGRRNVCYDQAALEARKAHKPAASAMAMASAMGIELLSEAEYRDLQSLGKFDLKTSSWLKTPAEIRKLGGALFADRRYDQVFVYHNGADSYYGARGFRGAVRV